MELEIVVKLLTIVVTVFTTYKVYTELVFGQKSRLRDEYKFAKEFFEQLNATPALHPFIIEKGYMAIAGDVYLARREIEYLLSLINPSTALRWYMAARQYLEHLPEKGVEEIRFKKKYSEEFARTWRKFFYLGGYIFLAFVGFVPLFFTKAIFGNPSFGAYAVVMMFLVGCNLIGLSSLAEYAKILRGESLIKSQRKHNGLVICNESSNRRNY